MSWGNKILIVIIVFIMSMFVMVYVAFQQTNEMVDENYYDKEIKYQALIDAAENLNKLNQDSIISQSDSEVELRVPKQLLDSFSNGNIKFLKNDDKNKDLEMKFFPDKNGLFLIDKSKFSKGIYQVRVQWKNGITPYYKEQKITIK